MLGRFYTNDVTIELFLQVMPNKRGFSKSNLTAANESCCKLRVSCEMDKAELCLNTVFVLRSYALIFVFV